MEQEQKQHPEIERIALSMQRAVYDYGERITARQLDVRTLTVNSGNGFELTLTDKHQHAKPKDFHQLIQNDVFLEAVEDFALKVMKTWLRRNRSHRQHAGWRPCNPQNVAHTMITARDILAITYTNAAPQGDTFEEAMDYIMRQIVEAAMAGRVRTAVMGFKQFCESPHAARIKTELRNAGFKFTTSTKEGCFVEWSIPAQRETKKLLEKRNAVANYTKTEK